MLYHHLCTCVMFLRPLDGTEYPSQELGLFVVTVSLCHPLRLLDVSGCLGALKV